jgi:hypothetical protein
MKKFIKNKSQNIYLWQDLNQQPFASKSSSLPLHHHFSCGVQENNCNQEFLNPIQNLSQTPIRF